MGYLDKTNIQDFSGNSFSIIKEGVHVRFTKKTEGEYGGSYNDGNYVSVLTKSIANLEFDSVLMSGLGIGVLAEWCAKDKGASVVDVVEIDSYLVAAVQDMNYLNPIVNVIEGNIYTYTPTKTYDIIIFDHWFFPDKDYTSQKESLTSHFLPHLNTGGLIFYAVNNEIIS